MAAFNPKVARAGIGRIWTALVPGSSETQSTLVGAVIGAAMAVAVALLKIRQGNFEAREQIEDREWRRHLLRQHGDGAPPP